MMLPTSPRWTPSGYRLIKAAIKDDHVRYGRQDALDDNTDLDHDVGALGDRHLEL